MTDLAARWLDHDPAKRASSRERDDAILSCHVLPALGTARLAAVTGPRAAPRDRLGFHEGTLDSRPPLLGPPGHVRLRRHRRPSSPLPLPGHTPSQGASGRAVTLDADQLDALAGELGPDQAVITYLGAVAGLRWAEAAGLTVGVLDLLRNRLAVTARLRRDGTLGPPKTDAGTRTLGIPAWLSEALASVLTRRGLAAADADALVFMAGGGAPLDYTNWRRRIWVPATRGAGLAGLRFHDLRSMATTVLVAAGVDVKTAQHRMGHSSPAVTLAVYARATEQADLDAVAKTGGFPSLRARHGSGPMGQLAD